MCIVQLNAHTFNIVDETYTTSMRSYYTNLHKHTIDNTAYICSTRTQSYCLHKCEIQHLPHEPSTNYRLTQGIGVRQAQTHAPRHIAP